MVACGYEAGRFATHSRHGPWPTCVTYSKRETAGASRTMTRLIRYKCHNNTQCQRSMHLGVASACHYSTDRSRSLALQRALIYKSRTNVTHTVFRRFSSD